MVTTEMRYVLLAFIAVTLQFSLAETCESRCNTNHDSTKPCQCNSHCVQYNDCCPDYQSQCLDTQSPEEEVVEPITGSSPSTCDLNCTVQAMWDKDVNRITSMTLNYQGKTTTSSTSDAATNSLFTTVSETAFQDSTSTFSKFIALLDNYNPTIGQVENLDTAESAEIDSFVDAIVQTDVMKLAYNYLLSKGKTSSEPDFEEKLRELWFNLYSRSSSGTILDSSGFEHAMVGEEKSTTISGFHNWVQFYLEEKSGRLDYLGWVAQAEPNIIAAKFEWNGKMKTKGSFFIGVSPEFDLAVYSICALTNPGSVCSFTLQGQPIKIQTWDINHKSGIQIGSAYPIL